jgi:formamidopyrimidine-DNA glycosylase
VLIQLSRTQEEIGAGTAGRSRFQAYLDSTALHQRVARVEVRDRRILGEVSARRHARTLRGHCLDSTHRHGKYLFARISEGAGWLVVHFGMTGSLGYFKGEEGENAAHHVLALVFEGRYRLVYNSTRKLGTVDLTDHPDRFVERKDLGPTPSLWISRPSSSACGADAAASSPC